MPKVAKEISPLQLKRLSKSGLHAVGGAPGLYLQIGRTGTSRSWILRTTVAGKRRDIGLGSYPIVSLADARQQARVYAAQIHAGIDPIEAKKAAKRLQVENRARQISFKEIALKVIDAKKAAWRNQKHHQQWTYSLANYAYPIIGHMAVGDIDLKHILQILEPIWHEKPETAKRVQLRIEKVLQWAIVHKYREGQNPAQWKNNLDQILTKTSQIKKSEHFKAMPLEQLPNFMADLQLRDGISIRALEFTILTAARTCETLGAQWKEIDLKNKIWTVPAARMKNAKEHRVPLSERAVALLRDMPRQLDCDYVFAGKGGKPLPIWRYLAL